eukprot:GHRQ01019587.1.p2 GENE.GHRQ01019587.1~~GHRQ01019587.1.p2  ORF type:complete len:120 (+),score=19.50 GHRQ01019587.1:266-625(+)
MCVKAQQPAGASPAHAASNGLVCGNRAGQAVCQALACVCVLGVRLVQDLQAAAGFPAGTRCKQTHNLLLHEVCGCTTVPVAAGAALLGAARDFGSPPGRAQLWLAPAAPQTEPSLQSFD